MQTAGGLLFNELQRTGFTSAAQFAADLQPEAGRYAQSHTGRLKLVLREEWNDILRSVSPARDEEDLARVIGFGCAVAEFSTCFLCPPALCDRIVQLGGLFNLAAGLYDFYLDHPPGSENFSFPRHTLQQALDEKNWSGLDALAKNGTPRQRVMSKLIRRYLEQIQNLADEKTPAHVHKTFAKLAMQMFDAQNLTGEHRGATDPLFSQRKSALPVVALGFPVWFTGTHHASCSYFNHLCWLYRLGNFISWVDDFADMEEDRDKGSPNRLLSETKLSPYAQAVYVADDAKKIMAHWNNFTIHAVSANEINVLFTQFVLKWLK